MANGYCLNCENRIALGNKPFIGQRAICKKCGADMEVIELSPIDLDWIYEVYEDINEEVSWEESD